MITTICQRWTRRRCTWRPAGEAFSPRHYEVASIADDTTARTFIETHHYAGSMPPARWRFGLYQFARGGLGPALVGLAVFTVPMSAAALRPFVDDEGHGRATELGRLVLLDQVPGNAESWFVARCLDVLRRGRGIDGVVSFSDPEMRATATGEVVFRGHCGTTYSALSAIYTGRATPRTLHLLPDASVLSDRTAQKIRAQERGWRAAVDTLVAHGAVAPTHNEDTREWLRRELARVTRPMRHGGNHKFLFPLSRAGKRAAREVRALAYPTPLRDLFSTDPVCARSRWACDERALIARAA